MVMKYQSDEELAQEQGIDPVTGKPISSAPGASLGSGTPPIQTPQESSGGGGTGFTSITQYLEQNRPQSSKLASQVGSFVTGKGEAARNQINEAQGKFNEQSAPVELNQDLLNRAITNPGDIVGNQDELEQFNKMKTAQYSGPLSLEGTDYFPNITKALDEAKTAGEETKSTTGQRNLLTEMAKTPNVTPGMTSLNQMLLINPEARTALGTAREGLNDLDSRLASASEAAKARAEANKTTTEATAGAVDKALRDRYQTFQNEILAKETEAEAKSKAMIDAYKNILLSGTMPTVPSGQQIKPGTNLFSYGVDPSYLGMTQEQLTDLLTKNTGLPKDYYTDLSQYLSALNPEVEINRANVAFPEDYAKWQALNTLSGGPDLYGGIQGFLPEESSGGYNPDMVNFDIQAAKDALSANYKKFIYDTYFGGKNPEFLIENTNNNIPNNFVVAPMPGWENVDPYKSW